ncbi:hypothetical protein [uncultured Pedobacter sp.]|uniref:hypothetical protein n=1 Tax=uncultured Pedobacter sp. TaxID=246139 RepID=UPI00262F8F51|nr:hypothetical protein [uncultured Pedobacter sp.]
MRIDEQNGASQHSDVIAVSQQIVKRERYIPSPVIGDEMYLKAAVEKAEQLDIAIYDLLGVKKIAAKVNVFAGNDRTAVDIATLPRGSYLVKKIVKVCIY